MNWINSSKDLPKREGDYYVVAKLRYTDELGNVLEDTLVRKAWYYHRQQLWSIKALNKHIKATREDNGEIGLYIAKWSEYRKED